ncbi:hypothetical protein AVEN_17396-1, partial [Araneus ventricosus]
MDHPDLVELPPLLLPQLQVDPEVKDLTDQ